MILAGAVFTLGAAREISYRGSHVTPAGTARSISKASDRTCRRRTSPAGQMHVWRGRPARKDPVSLSRLIVRIPFTLFGIASITAALLTGSGTLPLKGVWHLLMLPSYILHVAVAAAAVALVREPPEWLWLVSLALQLTFFAFLDAQLARRRSSRAGVATGRS